MRFAAFHLEVGAFDSYDKWDYKRSKKFFLFSSDTSKETVDVGPDPSFASLFRQECVKNTPRLWLDFSARKDDKNEANFEDVLYGDWRLVNECIRWLHLPLSTPTLTPKTNGDKTINKAEWRPPPLADCQRVLHIGSERSKLNMAQIADFVKTLVNVCLFL